MGYYIDFIFDSGKITSYQEVVSLFRNTGAVIIDRSKEDMPDHLREKYDRFVGLYYPEFRGIITVFKKESETLKGNWAHARVSWGETLEDLFNTLKFLLDLADKTGSRLYDGQIELPIEKENIELVLQKFGATKTQVAECFGTVRIRVDIDK